VRRCSAAARGKGSSAAAVCVIGRRRISSSAAGPLIEESEVRGSDNGVARSIVCPLWALYPHCLLHQCVGCDCTYSVDQLASSNARSDDRKGLWAIDQNLGLGTESPAFRLNLSSWPCQSHLPSPTNQHQVSTNLGLP
jgi:hypothetical protein